MNPLELIEGARLQGPRHAPSAQTDKADTSDEGATSFQDEMNETRLLETPEASAKSGKVDVAIQSVTDADALTLEPTVALPTASEPQKDTTDARLLSGNLDITENLPQISVKESGSSEANIELTPLEARLSATSHPEPASHGLVRGDATAAADVFQENPPKFREADQVQIQTGSANTGLKGDQSTPKSSEVVPANVTTGKLEPELQQNIETDPKKPTREADIVVPLRVTQTSDTSPGVQRAVMEKTSPELKAETAGPVKSDILSTSDDMPVQDLVRRDVQKNDQNSRVISDASGTASQSITASKPVLSGPEQSHGLIAETPVEDVDLVRHLEISGSRERILQPAGSLSNAPQFNANGARQIMGQVTAGLNQLAGGTVEIKLNPVELGRITIQLVEAVGGVQTASGMKICWKRSLSKPD